MEFNQQKIINSTYSDGDFASYFNIMEVYRQNVQYKTIILLLPFSENCCFALREAYRLRVSDKWVLRTIFEPKREEVPITVAARSKARTVFARSNAGIVGSNPTRGMHVCVYSVFVLGSGLATG
jgi:hypothetical protein